MASLSLCALLAAGELKPPTTSPATRNTRRRVVVVPPPEVKPTNQVPSFGVQEQAVAKIRSIYNSDYVDGSYPARRALARKLIEQGDETRRDTDAKFAFYREARDVAAHVGDVPTAFSAIDHMAAVFPVSRLANRVEALQNAVPMLGTAAANATVASMCIDLIDQCTVENDFSHADTLLALAETCAGRAQKRAYVSWVQWRRARFEVVRAAHERAKPAEATLKQFPDDPDANLVMGQFLCAVRGDWDGGLQHLLKGADRELAVLADRDLQIAEDRADEQYKLADAWWEFSRSQASDEQRTAMRKRAAYWYRRAMPILDGLELATAEQRVAEVAAPDQAKIPRPPDAMPYKGHLYRASIADVSWDDAVRLCEQAGGRLVCLETRLENEYVGKLARGKQLWIGAQLDGKGRWRWISNVDMFFSYWAHGEPKLAEPVGHPQFDEKGVWRVISQPTGYVCEWDN